MLDLTAVAEATEEEKRKRQGLVDWADAFNAESWEEVEKIENAGVKEARRSMEAIMSDNKQRQMLWDRKMAQWDYESQMKSARNEGRRIGWDEATLAAAKASDERDRKRACGMHARGRSNDEIALDMDVSVAQVREWIQ